MMARLYCKKTFSARDVQLAIKFLDGNNLQNSDYSKSSGNSAVSFLYLPDNTLKTDEGNLKSVDYSQENCINILQKIAEVFRDTDSVLEIVFLTHNQKNYFNLPQGDFTPTELDKDNTYSRKFNTFKDLLAEFIN
ncbi:MAG: hypothetical protein H6625_10495 [Bdellovibrionaceae bacterium]|nr:hypothetical protein [Pseudobdellovibrionaceae bacterium]